MGRGDLVAAELRDRLKLKNLLGNIDRKDIREADNKLKKLAKYVSTYDKIIPDIEKKISELNADGVEKNFYKLGNHYQVEFETVNFAVTPIILALRRQFLRLRELHRLEKNPKNKQIEENILKQFESGAMFSKVEQMSAFTMQFSDILSLLSETIHRLDFMNGQIEARKVYKLERKVKKDLKKELNSKNPKKVQNAEKKEEEDLNKLNEKLHEELGNINSALTNIIKFMQLEREKYEKRFAHIFEELDQNHAKYPENYYKKIKDKYDLSEKKVNDAIDEVTTNIKTLTQNIARSR